MKIVNPDGRGLDPEVYWMVSRTAIVEEVYFDNEQEARDFAAKHPHRGFTVEPPVKSAPSRDMAADKEQANG